MNPTKTRRPANLGHFVRHSSDHRGHLLRPGNVVARTRFSAKPDIAQLGQAFGYGELVAPAHGREDASLVRRFPHGGLESGTSAAHSFRAVIDRARILSYAQAVAREFHPERIILFGSYAYGTPNEDSDVDLLVVMPHCGHPAYQAAEIELKVQAGFPLDLLVRSPERIRERLAGGDHFVREILERGSPLYESGNAQVA